MKTIAPVAALLLAATAFGSETVIEVPQGSGVFPTVGQVDCLEEMGSGRFCAATYSDPEHPLRALVARGGGRHNCDPEPPQYGLVSDNLCVWVSTLGSQPDRSGGWLPPGRYAECRRLLEEQWEREGFGELQ